MPTATATYHFDGTTLLVTGGAGDIGRAVAQRCAHDGASIALVDLDEVKRATVVDALHAAGHDAEGYRCDVPDAEQVAATVAASSRSRTPARCC